MKLSRLNEVRWRPKSWGTTRLWSADIIATSSASLLVDFLVAFFPLDKADEDCERDRVERRTVTGSTTGFTSEGFFGRFDERLLG